MFVRTLISCTRSINPLVILSDFDILSEHQHVSVLKVILCCLTVLPDTNCFFSGNEVQFFFYFKQRISSEDWKRGLSMQFQEHTFIKSSVMSQLLKKRTS